MSIDTRHIRIEAYDYPLPDARIARYPVTPRDSSKLLVYDHGDISTHSFTDLPSLLPTGSLLVYNNTKVIRARLRFHKATGAQIEVFCLEPFSPADYAANFASVHTCEWLCMIGNAKKWKGEILHQEVTVDGALVTLQATRLHTVGTATAIRFSWQCAHEVSFAELLEGLGELPIPPYLHRATEDTDLDTYQTVYSKIQGSVAAPTAGLHFTDRVLTDMTQRGIQTAEVTLHVGAGTFKPVKADEIADHTMHIEWIAVHRHTIATLLAHGAQCVAVGTTSVRTLESLYYIGCKVLRDPNISEEQLLVQQWEPYTDLPYAPTAKEALECLLDYMDRHRLEVLHTGTQIIIAPGYTYHIVKHIITNFHQPKSTLLLLISAFLGQDHWQTVYRYALAHDYRFLSYGDSSLLMP